MFCQTNTLYVSFSIVGIAAYALDQGCCSIRGRSVLEDWNKLIDKVRIRGCEYDLKYKNTNKYHELWHSAYISTHLRDCRSVVIRSCRSTRHPTGRSRMVGASGQWHRMATTPARQRNSCHYSKKRPSTSQVMGKIKMRYTRWATVARREQVGVTCSTNLRVDRTHLGVSTHLVGSSSTPTPSLAAPQGRPSLFYVVFNASVQKLSWFFNFIY